MEAISFFHISEQGSDVACLHSSCNLLPSRGHSCFFEAGSATSLCIYNFSYCHGRDHVPLTKAGACQAEGGAAFYGRQYTRIVHYPEIFDM